jgi:hypothetical protein
MRLRRLAALFTVFAALIIVASIWDYYEGSGTLVLPGEFLQIVLNGLLLAIPTGDEYYLLPEHSFLFLSAAFYVSIVFILFLMIGLTLTERTRNAPPRDAPTATADSPNEQ